LENKDLDLIVEDLIDSYLEKLDSLVKTEEEVELEELMKKCPRCGSASANKSNPAGRCSSCLKKLASNKKKPNHYLHLHKLADDSLRRQRGKNGTAHKKTKGLGTRKEIIDKMSRAEKKTGQVLSPDRKDNGAGYAAHNVRAVDPKLNRGRHTVDPKKLAAWRKSLKKSDISVEEFNLLLLAKAEELSKANPELADILTALTKVLDQKD